MEVAVLLEVEAGKWSRGPATAYLGPILIDSLRHYAKRSIALANAILASTGRALS